MKGNVLGNSLKGLNKPAIKPVEESPKDPTMRSATTTIDQKKDIPIGVLFRLPPRDHEIVTDYARDLGMSIQELLERAINLMRKGDGLSEIEGRPRSKTRRRR